MTKPDESAEALMERIDNHLWNVFATGRNPWRAGAELTAKRLGMTIEAATRGVAAEKGAYARVLTRVDNRSRFRLATAEERERATPALLLPFDYWPENDEVDVLALSLRPGSNRFWRWAATVPVIGDPKITDGGALLLHENAHDYMGRVLRAGAARARGDDERRDIIAKGFAAARTASRLDGIEAALALPVDDPRRGTFLSTLRDARRAAEAAFQRWSIEMRWPDGELMLDPSAFTWTRRGILNGVDAIQIVDGPALGALGRALKVLNHNIGTPRGVPLYGVEASAATRGRAA